jgi:hypothetical protein
MAISQRLVRRPNIHVTMGLLHVVRVVEYYPEKILVEEVVCIDVYT